MFRDFDPITLRLFVAVCEERNIAGSAGRETLVASAVTQITLMSTQPVLLMVGSQVPARTVPEFVALAKSNLAP